MKNKIFQFLWYCIVKPLIPIDENVPKPFRYHRHFRAMIFLAKILGGAHGVLVGDSEIGEFNSRKVMSRFNKIIMNFGVGGTVAYEWTAYFRHEIGAPVYEYIRSLDAVVSTGGNYSLRSIMDRALHDMTVFHSLLPQSYIMLVPPVYANALAKLSKTESQWKEEMSLIRTYQIAVWPGRIVDTYSPFVDAYGDPRPGVLKDMVHFSWLCVGVIQRVLGWLM